jgi:2-amino-4-hydroxy-6-hydroxymethyldihydropteridine diphosphokinase
VNAAYIGLGSNLADPILQLRRAVRALSALPHSRLRAVSPVYRSAPLGPAGQPDYLNAAARLDTALDALALLDALQAIERDQGRRRSVRWGPRTLDLDLLLYGGRRIDHPRLSVPHPRLRERNFALLPLADVACGEPLLPGGEDLATLVSQCSLEGLCQTDLDLEI